MATCDQSHQLQYISAQYYNQGFINGEALRTISNDMLALSVIHTIISNFILHHVVQC